MNKRLLTDDPNELSHIQYCLCMDLFGKDSYLSQVENHKYEITMVHIKNLLEAQRALTLAALTETNDGGLVENPKIVCLCGSTKFKDAYTKANADLTMQGVIVLSVGLFGHADSIDLTEADKTMLDKLHLQKIDVADEILVLNVGGYIGNSTKREIVYATMTGKKVNYLEPQHDYEQRGG